MSINSKMTALAEEVRQLSGTTTPKGIDTMISDIDVANIEIQNQEDLIYLIASALEGKAGGGGSSVDTCTVTITSDKGSIPGYMFTVFENESFGSKSGFSIGAAGISTPVVVNNVVCNSGVFLYSPYSIPGFTFTNCDKANYTGALNFRAFTLIAEKDSNATIHCYNDD